MGGGVLVLTNFLFAEKTSDFRLFKGGFMLEVISLSQCLF